MSCDKGSDEVKDYGRGIQFREEDKLGEIFQRIDFLFEIFKLVG